MKRRKCIGILMLVLCLLLSGCSRQRAETPDTPANPQVSDTGFVASTIGSYDSADTAIVVKKNEEERTITFQNIILNKKYTLTYDGTTLITDKYNEGMSMAQIMPGDMVDITFLKEKKKLNTITISADCWTLYDVGRFEVEEWKGNIIIAGETYKLDKSLMIVSNGEQAELMDINACDVLSIRGRDHTVYSIVIEKGHGYLRLSNDEYLIGGWIEVGQSIIQLITEDMLLTVPEGSYQVLLSNGGAGGSKEVTILRNSEVELDVGDLKGEIQKTGNIIFSVTPASASVYVDGNKVDASEMVPLEYGIHQMIVKAEGYRTVTQFLKVGTPFVNIDVQLEILTEESEEETEDTDAEEETTTTTSNSLSGYRVYIDAPTGVELYVDGNYVGVTPTNFKKEEGSRILTLRLSGYQTRSYTVQIDNEEKDISYSFSNLEKTDLTSTDILNSLLY